MLTDRAKRATLGAYARAPRPFLRARASSRPTDASRVEAHEMAKALLGHVGALPDRRLVDEVAHLRSRVRDLEAELARLHAERDRTLERGLRQLSELPEPALA
jgi:hypothetical protein